MDDQVLKQVAAGPFSMPVHGLRRFDAWLKDNPDAMPLYHIGNSANYHAVIVDTLRLHPGIVVLHDLVLFHLFAGMTLENKKAADFLDLMQSTYGLEGLSAAQGYISGEPFDFAYPLVEPVLDDALGVITHNRFVLNQVRMLRPSLPATQVNMHYTPSKIDGRDREAVRKELGLDGRLVVASYGWITPNKRVDVALRAFARLRKEYPEAIYVLVGQLAPEYDLMGLVSSLGLVGSVIFTGRKTLSEFIQYMYVTDIALNLRYPTAGETSASLIRLLGMGVPTLVSNVGGFGEFPDACCAKVDVDDFEEETILAILRRLAEDAELCRQMGENARRYITQEHDPARTAEDYMRFIRTVTGGRLAGRLGDTETDFLDELGELMVGLGVGEQDDEALKLVADALVGMGFGEEAA